VVGDESIVIDPCPVGTVDAGVVFSAKDVGVIVLFTDAGSPMMGWTSSTVYSLRDVNEVLASGWISHHMENGA
jgi:hypothetical protein